METLRKAGHEFQRESAVSARFAQHDTGTAGNAAGRFPAGNFEMGVREGIPRNGKLLMLCDMFGVTLDDLVMGDVRASAGCGGAGRVDLAADTDGVAASVGVADAAVGAVPGVIGFAASQVAGMSDSGESDVRDTNPNVCASVSGESDAQGAKTGVQLSVSAESDMRGGRQVGWNP